MRNNYKRLTLQDRVRIEVLLSKRTTYAGIGHALGKDRSTIKREVDRYGKAIDGYDSYYAHFLSEGNKGACKKKKRMEDVKIANYVLYWLKQGRSPEVIAGRLKYEIEQGLEPCSIYINHETIYDYIYDTQHHSEKLWQYLRYGKKKRTKQHTRRARHEIIEGRVFIDHRPAVVDDRIEIGHWETDTVMYGMKKGINTLVERLARYTLLTRLLNKTPKETEEAIVKRLREHLVKTITGDNGVENRNHRHIADTLHATFYFCHPYHSWEKGSNENLNGMLRRYLSKHTDLDTVTDQELADIEYELNSRPRKILGFKSPIEVLHYHYQFVALAN